MNISKVKSLARSGVEILDRHSRARLTSNSLVLARSLRSWLVVRRRTGVSSWKDKEAAW